VKLYAWFGHTELRSEYQCFINRRPFLLVVNPTVQTDGHSCWSLTRLYKRSKFHVMLDIYLTTPKIKLLGFGGFQDSLVYQERGLCDRVGSNRQSLRTPEHVALLWLRAGCSLLFVCVSKTEIYRVLRNSYRIWSKS